MDTVNGVVTLASQAVPATTVTRIDLGQDIGRTTFSFPVRGLVGKCWVMCKHEPEPAPAASDVQNYGEEYNSASPRAQVSASGSNAIYIYCENAFTVYAQWGS